MHGVFKSRFIDQFQTKIAGSNPNLSVYCDKDLNNWKWDDFWIVTLFLENSVKSQEMLLNSMEDSQALLDEESWTEKSKYLRHKM